MRNAARKSQPLVTGSDTLDSVSKPRGPRGDLVRTAAEIFNDDPEIRFNANIFVQLSLPYKNPKDAPVWTRHNGHQTLLVEQGWVSRGEGTDSVPAGLPYGVPPRLMLSYLTTEAVRTGEAWLELGDSLTAFMTELGLKPTGGKNGSITKLRQQTERLFHAKLSIQDNRANQQRGMALNVASAWKLGWSSRAEDPNQLSLLPSRVRLSADFFEYIVENPVPLNMAALNALRGSALRLDLYSWLTYRMSYCDRPTVITWEQLSKQFGSNLADTRSGRSQFRSAIKAHLEKVLIVYREANVDVLDTGLRLRPSPTHVPFRGTRELKRAASRPRGA